MGPRFSIVVPCYNEARYLADTVNSLRAQTFAGSYEIIVVDNNCTDETADIARELGVRVVSDKNPGVCWARQKGTEEIRGEIVISADADTTYSADWLATVDRAFGTDERIVAVAGPCRYVGGPRWGRAYAQILFGGVHLIYRMTGRTLYVTATNIAFRKKHWFGYDVNLTQGGDELNLLRDLRGRGRVVYDHSNPTYTSSRRLTRGVLYGFFVTLLVYYLLAYFLNRLFKRRVIGGAGVPQRPESAVAPAPDLRRRRTVRTPAAAFLPPTAAEHLRTVGVGRRVRHHDHHRSERLTSILGKRADPVLGSAV